MKKMILGALAGVLTLSGLIVAPVAAVTCPEDAARKTAPSYAECNLVEDSSLWPTVNNVINVVVGIIGVVAVGAVIFGGFQYVMSQGDPGKLKKAKDTILYGIIGLVVALLAFAIVNFVLQGIQGPTSSTTPTKTN